MAAGSSLRFTSWVKAARLAISTAGKLVPHRRLDHQGQLHRVDAQQVDPRRMNGSTLAWKLNPSRQPATGHTAAVLQRLNHVEENIAAHGVHRRRPLLFKHGFGRTGLQFLTADHLTGAQAAQNASCPALPVAAANAITQAGQQRHSNTANATGGPRDQHSTGLGRQASLFQLGHAECSGQSAVPSIIASRSARPCGRLSNQAEGTRMYWPKPPAVFIPRS